MDGLLEGSVDRMFARRLRGRFGGRFDGRLSGRIDKRFDGRLDTVYRRPLLIGQATKWWNQQLACAAGHNPTQPNDIATLHDNFVKGVRDLQ